MVQLVMVCVGTVWCVYYNNNYNINTYNIVYINIIAWLETKYSLNVFIIQLILLEYLYWHSASGFEKNKFSRKKKLLTL